MKPSALFEGRTVPWPDPLVEKAVGGGYKTWTEVPEFIRTPWQLDTLQKCMMDPWYRPEHLPIVVRELMLIVAKTYNRTTRLF